MFVCMEVIMRYQKIVFALGTLVLLASACTEDKSNAEKCGDRYCYSNETCINDVCTITTPLLCEGKTCTGNQKCNPANGECEENVVDLCAGKICPGQQQCNPLNGECAGGYVDLCAGKTCTSGTCNPATGDCEGGTENKCEGKTCTSGTCNPATGECEGGTENKCDGVTCTYGTCNPETGDCEGVCTDGCEAWQFCALAGNCVNYKGYCSTAEDCDNATDTCKDHFCVAACEMEDSENIVPNWSFEEWNGSNPVGWSLDMTDYTNAEMIKSKNSSACDNAIELKNSSTSNARLVSDIIPLPEANHLQNEKYSCSVKVSGTGRFYTAYYVIDKDGNETLKDNETSSYIHTYDDHDYKYESFTIKYDPQEYVAVRIAIGFRKDNGGANCDLIIDEVSCTRDETVCDDKKCEDWEICTTANYGKCVPKDGFCNATTGCNSAQTCDPNTHTCKLNDGGCLRHEDCNEGQKCDFTSHTCVTGDPCEGVTCDEWKQCNARSGKCELKDGRCNKSLDCNQNLPACKYATHTCVSADDPVNIVPNGGFEQWENVSIYENSSQPESVPKYDLPVSWYGQTFEIDATHFATEIDPKLVKKYTTNTHTGTSALQIEFTGQPADRFTSKGFNVGNGLYDCSFWVRGKGDVRIHSHSSRGEAKHTDYVTYDTADWVRVPFGIKSNASAMRLIFYVSNTDASKDHIQIDDVVCTKYDYN